MYVATVCTAEQHGLGEWVGVMVAIIYPSEQVEERYLRTRDS